MGTPSITYDSNEILSEALILFTMLIINEHCQDEGININWHFEGE